MENKNSDNTNHELLTLNSQIDDLKKKMNLIATTIDRIVHDINNPLSGIAQSAQLINNRLTSDIAANLEAAEQMGIPFDKVFQYCENRKIFFLLNQIAESTKNAAIVTEKLNTFIKENCKEN